MLIVTTAPSVYGSSYRFEINVDELGSSQPLFTFSKSVFLPPRWTTSTVALNGLLVVSKYAGNWDYKNPMWAFELKPGAALELGKIKYGDVPHDFIETTAEKSLQAGEQYFVLAFWLGSSGSKEFMLRQEIRNDK